MWIILTHDKQALIMEQQDVKIFGLFKFQKR